MKFNTFIFITFFITSLSHAENKKPNIIWLYSDDQAFQAISAYKSRFAKFAPTPNIDRLANEGMLFQKSYVANSICAPARACILTGKHSHKNGVLNNGGRIDYTTQITFPQLLQKSGYKTAMYGKWHLKNAPQGFDDWAVLPGQGSYHNPDYRVKKGDTEEKVREHGWVDDVTTDKALEFLRKQNKDEPFLLMCQFKAPHRAWRPPIRHIDTYEDIIFPEPETLFDNYEGREAAQIAEMRISDHASMKRDLHMSIPTTLARLDGKDLAVATAKYNKINAKFEKLNLKEGSKEWVQWKYQRYIKEFMRCVRGVDDNVGRLLDYLKKTGLDKNTIVCYSGDQGFYLGEHGWFDKRFIYEESFRTPLLMRWPETIKPSSINHDLVQNIDMAPTFLEIAGLAIPNEVQGKSILPLLKGHTPNHWRDSLYYHYYEYKGGHRVPNHEAIATKRYKLVNFYDLDHKELIDLHNDPNEVNNQYHNPEYKEIIHSLEKKLQQKQIEFSVPELPAINTEWRYTPEYLAEMQSKKKKGKKKTKKK